MEMDELTQENESGGRGESLLRELLDAVPAMMGVVELLDDGSDLRHVYDSPATERFFGTGPGLTAGKTASRLGVPSETIATWVDRCRESARHDRPVRFEFPHPGRDGELWISAVVAPMKGDGSGGLRFSYAMEDVSERKAAEAAFAESQARLQDLADNMDQLAWIADASGAILWYNRRWYEFTGTSPQDMEGWGWQRVHDPKELPWVLEMWAARLSSDAPFDMEFPLKGADGAFRTFLTRVRPIRGTDGRVARWFGTNTDVTERRESEERLRESEARANLAIQAAELGTWEADLRRKSVRFGGAAAAILGWSGAEFPMGAGAWEGRVHPDDLPTLGGAFRAMLDSGAPMRATFRARAGDGAWRWVETSGLLAKDAEGNPVRAIGVLSDVTERKAAQAELERRVAERTAQLQASNDALESFTRHVAHDLRGPIRTIGLACHVARDELGDSASPAVLDTLGRQERAAKRLNLLIDDLLEMARLSRTEAVRTPTDLTKMANSVAQEALAAHPGSTVRVDVQEGLATDVDPRLFRLALGNLVENAVKYSPHGGTVRVGRRDDGALFVSDEGIGIDPEYHEKIFEPFLRLHGDAAYKGTGIGLSNVRQIVSLHGGRVWVERGLGKGSTFVLTLG